MRALWDHSESLRQSKLPSTDLFLQSNLRIETMVATMSFLLLTPLVSVCRKSRLLFKISLDLLKTSRSREFLQINSTFLGNHQCSMVVLLLTTMCLKSVKLLAPLGSSSPQALWELIRLFRNSLLTTSIFSVLLLRTNLASDSQKCRKLWLPRILSDLLMLVHHQ